jgi:flagellin-like hook-associated protein FlgL
MLSGLTLSPVMGRIAAFYQSNESFLNHAANQLASGKRNLNPSDNIADYFRADAIRRENSVRQMFQRDMAGVKSVLDVAEKAGDTVYQHLLKMQDDLSVYQDPTSGADVKRGASDEFNALITEINTYIDAAGYNGMKVIQDTTASTPLASLNLDPNDITQTMDISFTSADVANPTGLDITDPNVGTALQAEVDKAGSYMAKVTAYKVGLTSQANIMQTTLINNGTFESDLANVDEGSTTMAFTKQSIQQQYASSMMLQWVGQVHGLVDLLK